MSARYTENVSAEPLDIIRRLEADADQGLCTGRFRRLFNEIERLEALVNTPETEDFAKGAVLEAAHQRARWGEAHDRDKSAENWFWLVGYLAGKALRASIDGNREKALHHCISSAAALCNWHAAIARDLGGRGEGSDRDLERLASK
jgi:hypothetical protein